MKSLYLFLLALLVSALPAFSIRPLTFGLFGLAIVLFGAFKKEANWGKLVSWTTFFIVPPILLLFEPDVSGVTDMLFFSIFLLVYGIPSMKRQKRWGISLYLGFMLGSIGAIRHPSVISLFSLFTYLFLSVWILTALHVGDSKKNIGRAFLPAGILWGITIPFTVLLFFALPRPGEVLFKLKEEDNSIKSGLSDEIRLGDIGEIQKSSRIIFRAKTKKIPDKSLYWRGVVLDSFDGKIWHRIRGSWREIRSINSKGEISEEIEIETPQKDILPGLDLPIKITPLTQSSIFALPGNTFININTRPGFRYRVISSTIQKDRTPPTRRDLLLYPTFSQKIRETAIKIKGDSDTPLQTASKISQFLKTSLLYSLSLNSTGRDPIYSFLFIDKKGNCEYFASALAILLRSIGIPSRVVAGFRGGAYNKYGSYYIVRGQNAHVWTEVWDEKEGWVPLDPTPPTLVGTKPESIGWIQGITDVLKMRWRSVLGSYTYEDQIKFLKTASIWLKKGVPLLAILFLLSILGVFLKSRIVGKKRSKKLHPATRVFIYFEKSIGKKGVRRKGGETPLQFMKRIAGDEGENLALIYYSLRYNKISEKDLKRFNTGIKSLLSRL